MSFKRQMGVEGKKICSDPLPCGPFHAVYIHNAVYAGILLLRKAHGIRIFSVFVK